MNYFSYKQGVKVIFLLCIPLFLLDALGPFVYIRWKESFISALNYYVLSILSLYLLFLSVYAHFAGVKGTRKYDGPIFFIILSTIAVVLLFGVPISNYLLIQENKSATLSNIDLSKMKKEALNVNSTSWQRYLSATDYFLETGERIPYLDAVNKKVTYIPDERALKIRNKRLEHEHQLKLMKAHKKNRAIVLGGILLSSLTSFLLLLWHKIKFRAET